MQRFFYGGLIVVFLFAIAGELARLPFGPANGILPNDLWVGILVFIGLIYKIGVQRTWPPHSLSLPFFAFSTVAALSLLNGSRFLTSSEFLTSGLYWIRFVEYFMLTFLVADLAKNKQFEYKLFSLLMGAGALLAIFGFIQLKLFPDFREFQELGWDPHIDRLLSTWFDPNFIGGLFAFLLSLCMGKIVAGKAPKWIFMAGGLMLLALFLTYSRSGYLAFLVSITLFGILKSRKFLLAMMIAGFFLISVSDRAAERVTNLYHSALSIVTDSTELPDATARLRIESWENTLEIISDHPFLGVGYNAFGFAQQRYGFVQNIEQHSSTGSDSTLLTILATTGILGLVAYLWILITLLWKSLSARDNPLALSLFTATLGLLVHSVFVNSLLYTPLLIFFYASAGLILPQKKISKSQKREHCFSNDPACRQAGFPMKKVEVIKKDCGWILRLISKQRA